MKNTLYQLPSVNGGQMNSYIITTADGKVLAIDGGFRENADDFLAHLRRVTGAAVPHVDAWLLTHPHVDHISCFNEIVEKHWDELTVGKVMFHFPSVQYCVRDAEEARGDHVPIIEQFMANLPRFADRVVLMYTADAYDIGEAHIDVLYTANGEIQNNNWINESSTIFKLTLGGKTVLFTGDAGVEEGRRCLAYYAGTDRLKADYVQMAHHGQKGVEREFYEAVAPTGCLWCTPEWLWNNDAGGGFNTHCFKTVEVRGWMDELGVKEHYVMKDGLQILELS